MSTPEDVAQKIKKMLSSVEFQKLDKKQQERLMAEDPSYREYKENENKHLGIDADIRDPEQRKIISKIIDGKETEDTLREEVEDLKSKLGIIAERQFDKKRSELGAPPEIDTPEKLQGYEQAIRGKKEFGGSAPMNSAQMGVREQDLARKSYSSYKEMLEDLRSKAHLGDKVAENYLGQIINKYLQDKKGNPTRPEPNYDPNSPEALSELGLHKEGNWLVPEQGKGDIARILKSWAEQRRKKMGLEGVSQ